MTHVVGGAYFYTAPVTPHPEGAGPTISKTFEIFITYARTVWPRANKFGSVFGTLTHKEKERNTRGQPRPIETGGPQRPNSSDP